jgi:hypothetical protein
MEDSSKWDKVDLREDVGRLIYMEEVALSAKAHLRDVLGLDARLRGVRATMTNLFRTLGYHNEWE